MTELGTHFHTLAVITICQFISGILTYNVDTLYHFIRGIESKLNFKNASYQNNVVKDLLLNNVSSA